MKCQFFINTCPIQREVLACQIPCLWVICFRAVQLSTLKYTMTGDLHFLMPIFGLLPCGSSNPCLYCPLERRKVRGVAVWQSEQVALRTFGSLEPGGVYFSGKLHDNF